MTDIELKAKLDGDPATALCIGIFWLVMAALIGWADHDPAISTEGLYLMMSLLAMAALFFLGATELLIGDRGADD